MSTAPPDTVWIDEFGIADEARNYFFTNKTQLDALQGDVPQAHVLRRAFDLLKLDGILCAQKTPLVYFKRVTAIDSTELSRLHRTFWNHGGAPVLVLVAPDQVHIYSGLVRPAPNVESGANIRALVETLDRASTALRAFLPAVESGEFFRRHEESFNPAHRVDRDLLDNLQATREEVVRTSSGGLDSKILDALLCRLVFACYLFDRKIIGQAYLDSIGLVEAHHLRDVLGLRPKSKAKKYLYGLFEKLGDDFNGDLFSDDLVAEAEQIPETCIDPLDAFFRATDVATGQGSFWPYDFSVIPVEAISAIYERFLKGSDKDDGAFYTPRFLAELVLGVALSTTPSLLGRRYLDPACGSGIFLVALFNRIAEEWRARNPDARNDRRARELRKILCSSLSGVDINPTACRITAFSLYLAYLDQLSPRDIQELQQKGHRLPRLVHNLEHGGDNRAVEGDIWCGDFFVDSGSYPVDADLVIGNPPWGSRATDSSSAAQWCAHPDHRYPIPDKQIALAFVWKATHHVAASGTICLVLPHGILFNHSTTALQSQRTLFERHAVQEILNLADYQRFLFEEAAHPGVVVVYRKAAPESLSHVIKYWAPKADWLVTRAEVIAVTPEDRTDVTVGQVLRDLEGRDAPQIWKQHYWATPRDWRLIDRLSLYSRLRDHVRSAKDRGAQRRWLMAEGFQPPGESDDLKKSTKLQLPSKLFIEASSKNINLFLLREDCVRLPSAHVTVRSGSNKGTDVFRAPHVLVAQGFTSVAYADFDVSFRHALRGIAGPPSDRALLVFVAAYMRSTLAKYFLFHTSSNWGVGRQKIHVEELLRLPLPLPEALPDARRSWEIIKKINSIVASAAEQMSGDFVDRRALVRNATESIDSLVDQYFDILPNERTLVDDTVRVTIPSVRPTRQRRVVPTIEPSQQKHRDEYTRLLCETLNEWAKNGPFVVRGGSIAESRLGIGVAILRKTRSGQADPEQLDNIADLLPALERLRRAASDKHSSFELLRGAKVFDRDRLYLVKPIGQRFWTKSAALNDADEIAGTILTHTPSAAWP